MKITRAEKGITLVALIITIIVLLILAMVAIGSLTGNHGIVTQAEDAKGKYQQNVIAEQSQLSGAAQKIETMIEAVSGGNGGTTGEGNVALGSFVTYRGTTWRVLKNDSSSVELVSNNAVSSKEIGSESDPIQYFTYVGEFLDSACGAYVANGEAISFSVRSVSGSDLSIMTSLGMLVSANTTEYWINQTSKSRSYGDSNSDGVDEWFDECKVHYVTSNGTTSSVGLFTHHELGGTMGPVNTYTKSIRPVVTLSAGALDNVTGSGTSGQPYVLN